MILLRKPLAIIDTANLLQVTDGDIRALLAEGSSLFSFPLDNNQLLHAIDVPLQQFLLSERRSAQYFIDPFIHHRSIALDCLKVIFLGASQSGMNAPEQVYASLNWCWHLYSGMNRGEHIDSELTSSFTTLLTKLFLRHFDAWANTVLLHRQTATIVDQLSALIFHFQVTILCSYQHKHR